MPPSADGKPSAMDLTISFPLLVRACNLEKQRASGIVTEKPMVVVGGKQTPLFQERITKSRNEVHELWKTTQKEHFTVLENGREAQRLIHSTAKVN